MKNVNDIIKENLTQPSISATEIFSEILKRQIHHKYKGINEAADLKKFKDDHRKYLLEIENFQNSTSKRKISKNTSLSYNDTQNWLDPEKDIKRKSIIDIAFILADHKNKNGEKIANELLGSMHYPKLHASSELEIFYIYALLNGLSYTECLKLYKTYLERDKIDFPTEDIAYEDTTSSKFYKKVEHITDAESLFSFVDSKRQYFGIGSRKMNGYFSDTFKKMLNSNFKIVIKSYENADGAKKAALNNIDNADRIADVIMDALEIHEDARKKEKAKILDALKKAQRKIDKKPLTLYIKGEKQAISVRKCISDCGGNVTMRNINQIELKLDFYLFYASNQSLKQFLKKFSETPAMLYVPTGSKKDEFHAPINSRRFDHYFIYKRCDFYPINPITFTSIFDNIDSVLKNKKSFSREGMLLWFLYYFIKNNQGENYDSLTEINEFISTRYQMLDTSNYFDRFIVMLLTFKLKEGKVFYGNEEIDPSNLNTTNIHELRHSIIQLCRPYFDSNFSVNLFEDNDNLTTSLIFKSTKDRLGFK